MRCDKKKAQLFSSTGAKNEHTPGGQAEMRNGFVRHVLCRAHPQAAPVCVRALLSGGSEAEGKRGHRDLMHSRQQTVGKLCTPRGSGRMMEIGACGVNQSAGCPQVGAGDQLMRANCGRANRRRSRRFFGGATKNLEDDASMRYHQMQVNLSRGSRIVEFSRPEFPNRDSGMLRRVGTR